MFDTTQSVNWIVQFPAIVQVKTKNAFQMLLLFLLANRPL